MNIQPSFHEEQRFRQPWVWVLILLPVVFGWYAVISDLFFDRSIDGDPTPDVVLILIAIVLGILLPWFMYSLRLITQVRPDGLYIRFFPFHRSFKRFPWQDIVSSKAQKYRPVLHYGGWGIKYGIKGKVYNVSGNEGVLLEFSNGKKLMIGSQKAYELELAIKGVSKKYGNKSPRSISDLLAGVNKGDLHEETDWGPPVSKEIW